MERRDIIVVNQLLHHISKVKVAMNFYSNLGACPWLSSIRNLSRSPPINSHYSTLMNFEGNQQMKIRQVYNGPQAVKGIAAILSVYQYFLEQIFG